MRRAAGLSEATEQKILVRWLRSRGVMVFAVVNEGRRSGMTTNHLKAMGLTPGVPDLVIVNPAQPRAFAARPNVVCVELKAQRRKTERHGGLSPEQRAWHAAAAMHGWKILVAHGAKDAVAQLQELGY